MQRALDLWTRGFVVWVVAFSAAAYFLPGPFSQLRPGIRPGLGIIMLGMGMTLVPDDFRRVLTMPRAVACGVLGQFVVMPLVAWTLVVAFRLPPDLAMGFIILGACPGGTASNVIAYLARADVALSVTMTACSTLASVVATPLLVSWIGGAYLEVDTLKLLRDVATIVLLPVTAGLALRVWLGKRLERALQVFPAISVLVIVLIIACVVALSREKIVEAFGILGVLVLLHNSLGLGLGYGLATLFRLPPDARRTVAIEVGMQNSGLGVALATGEQFAGRVLVALPSSLFSVVHNLTGSLLASWWGRDAPDPDDDTRPIPDR